MGKGGKPHPCLRCWPLSGSVLGFDHLWDLEGANPPKLDQAEQDNASKPELLWGLGQPQEQRQQRCCHQQRPKTQHRPPGAAGQEDSHLTNIWMSN